MMKILSKSPTILEQYSTIPMRFVSHSIFEVQVLQSGLGGFVLKETPLVTPFEKDYDALDGEGPLNWSRQFDISQWGFLVVEENEQLIAGATIAMNTPNVHMLEGRKDLAVLWDIRVSPSHQGQGIGHQLFQACETWIREKGGTTLKIETQNNNVPACKFYLKQGCELGAIHRFAYPELPNEVQLLWYKQLLSTE